PATVITFRDYWGNAVHDFGVPYLHDHLTIEATSTVVTFAAADEPLAGPREGEPDRSPPLGALAADPLLADEWAEFLVPSTYVALEAASGDLARALLVEDPAATAYAFLRRAGARIRERLTYRLGVTTAHSTVADVIAAGSGVCQDYTHLLLAVCRHAGLPARYVSGYLGDVVESEASHAWAEAFIPPYGWVGLDPTAGGPCTGRHVKVAVGRDYADVAVVRGVYRGGADATLAVTVRSETLDRAETLALVGGAGLGADGVSHGRGKLIQYQTLGAMTQMRRLGAMTMTQTLGDMTQTLAMPLPGMPVQRDESEVPRQQPQQQQQAGRGRTGEIAGRHPPPTPILPPRHPPPACPPIRLPDFARR
ncbi:MAG: transglutaminase family protein, partial [Chloroflexota bacterium]|nr:transglutaminase family protein [Chloroflexota bacterium]